MLAQALPAKVSGAHHEATHTTDPTPSVAHSLLAPDSPPATAACFLCRRQVEAWTPQPVNRHPFQQQVCQNSIAEVPGARGYGPHRPMPSVALSLFVPIHLMLQQHF